MVNHFEEDDDDVTVHRHTRHQGAEDQHTHVLDDREEGEEEDDEEALADRTMLDSVVLPILASVSNNSTDHM